MVAHFDGVHSFSYLYHIAGKLMSQYDRIKMYAVMQDSGDVGPTDTGGFYLNLYSAGCDLRLFIIHITYVFICAYNCCFHFLSAPFRHKIFQMII